MEIDPDLVAVHASLGAALAARRRLAEAIIHFQKVLDSQPDSPEAHGNLGAVLANCGRLDEALVHFQKALEIKPDSPEAHGNLAAALAGCGQVKEAIAHYQRALEIYTKQNKQAQAESIRAKIRFYEVGTPIGEPPSRPAKPAGP